MAYADGFLTPVPKRQLATYRASWGNRTSFPRARRMIFGGFKPLVTL